MAQDPIDMTEAIAELSRLLVSHGNMQDVFQEVIQVTLCRVPGWTPPRSVSCGASRLAPPAAKGPRAVELDETEYEQEYDSCLDAGQASEVAPIEETPVAGIPATRREAGTVQFGVHPAAGRASLAWRAQPLRPHQVGGLPSAPVAVNAPATHHGPPGASPPCLLGPVTGQTGNPGRDRPWIDAAVMRQHIAAAAAAVAVTENKVADTFDRLAITRPHDAVRLRARAAQARQYASKQRRYADAYRTHGLDAGTIAYSTVAYSPGRVVPGSSWNVP